jgi:hypothetical protein
VDRPETLDRIVEIGGQAHDRHGEGVGRIVLGTHVDRGAGEQ